ncbi:MAG: hypothetical protein WC601_11945 [Desulfotomaculaceae bacterium]
MLADKENHNTSIKTLEAQKEGINYRLEYAPVGNNIQEPTVIICGITPGNGTWRMFLNAIRSRVLFEKAARESIYSNMRENLFKCLDEIDLFNYLADINEYWDRAQKEKNNKDYWYKLFNDEIASEVCGIQLTQACNCAILRDNDSQQPSRTALNEIREGEPGCLFNRFQISSSLKLIIFLGTTLNLEEYWEESCYFNSNVRLISIPHPSGSNRVFNNGDLFKPLSENDNTQLINAKNLLKKAKQTINDLKNETVL